jgi:hypothetical protein
MQNICPFDAVMHQCACNIFGLGWCLSGAGQRSNKKRAKRQDDPVFVCHSSLLRNEEIVLMESKRSFTGL